MALQWVATAALAGAEGALSAQPLEPSTLRLWRLADRRVLLRPPPWRTNLPGALEASELAPLMREGMALMPYQDSGAAVVDVAPENLSHRHGSAAATVAKTLRIGDGGVIWLMTPPKRLRKDPACFSLVRYLNSWSRAIRDGRYHSGLFLTTAIPLANPRFEWLARWDFAVATRRMGFAASPSMRRCPERRCGPDRGC